MIKQIEELFKAAVESSEKDNGGDDSYNQGWVDGQVYGIKKVKDLMKEVNEEQAVEQLIWRVMSENKFKELYCRYFGLTWRRAIGIVLEP